MKNIAALLLTIALALFPLSGSRAVGVHAHGTPPHAQAAAPVGDEPAHHGGGHRQQALIADAEAATLHLHASPEDHRPEDAAPSPCSGDHGSSSCCSVSCHAMAPLAGVAVPAQRHVVLLMAVATLPMPHGVGFDGLLRPPRSA